MGEIKEQEVDKTFVFDLEERICIPELSAALTFVATEDIPKTGCKMYLFSIAMCTSDGAEVHRTVRLRDKQAFYVNGYEFMLRAFPNAPEVSVVYMRS
ncbi:MAG: hypothetical protein ACLFSL_05350 [Candidatus Woesearchaeota archaeon]